MRDLVQVLEADKYRSAQPASFQEGDWNEDGVFDQCDLILTLQTGTYLADVEQALSRIPKARPAADEAFADPAWDSRVEFSRHLISAENAMTPKRTSQLLD